MKKINKTLYRDYCKQCKDFTIHDEKHICTKCNTEFSDYNLNDIEDYSIIEKQQKRYRESKLKEFKNMFGTYINAVRGILLDSIMVDFHNKVGESEIEIIEADAGVIEIENKKKRKKKG